jgi:ABC-type multidrug transport system permease subunit
MLAAILPMMSVERGSQMVFVLQSCLLLVSGVYYSTDILPGWMQLMSRISPATYVLDAVRKALIDGASFGQLLPDLWPLVSWPSSSSRSGCGASAGPSATPSGPASSREWADEYDF